MKKTDYPRLKHELTKILPVHQTEAWNIMRISHQDMSDVVLLMLAENLIKRTKSVYKGRATFYIEPKMKNFSPLLAGTILSPCIGCSLHCEPQHCNKITEWVLQKV